MAAPDAREQVLGERAQRGPAALERLLDGAVLVRPLAQEVELEAPAELQKGAVAFGELLLADHGGEATKLLQPGAGRVELVRERSVVLPRAAVADPVLHEPRERG